MSVARFVIFHVQGEWWVSYEDEPLACFPSRAEAEDAAFEAANAEALSGSAVTVLIMPESLRTHARPPRMSPNPERSVRTGIRPDVRDAASKGGARSGDSKDAPDAKARGSRNRKL